MIPGIVASIVQVPGNASFDPYYLNTGLILRGEGADGNTTFVDYSAGARPIAGYGAVENDTAVDVQGTPSLLFGAYANYLDRGMSDAILIDDVGPTQWCMECYAKFTDVSAASQQLMGRRRDSNDWVWSLSSGTMTFSTFSGTTGFNRLATPALGLSNGVTYHLCVIRDGDTVYGFVDGVLAGSTTTTWNMGIDRGETSQGLYIGRSDTNTSRYVRGSLNHIRITLGTTRYSTSGFGPDAVPHLITGPTAVAATEPTEANVELLMSFDGNIGTSAFPDQSGKAHLLTFVGNAQLSNTQAKWGTTSLKLDGSGDYVEVRPSTANALDTIGDSDLTVEAWVYVDSLTADREISSQRDGTLADGHNFTVLSDGRLAFRLYNAGAEILYLKSTVNAIGLTTWHHVAAVINVTATGTFARLFIDGMQVDWGYLHTTASANAGPTYIGHDPDSGTFFSGYISDYRITRQALYTGNFIPLESPHTQYISKAAALNPAFSNVALLVGFDGADGDTTDADDSPNAATLTFNGSTQLDDAQSRFGGTSLLCNGGNSDYISLPSIADYQPANNDDMTWEVWVRPTAACLALGTAMIFAKRNSSGNEFTVNLASGAPRFSLWSGNTPVVDCLSTFTLTADVWQHLAFVKKGSVYSIFVDGDLKQSVYGTSSIGSNTDVMLIGASNFTTGREWEGWLDEARISDEAFYPLHGFLPPTAVFPRS